MDRWAAIRQCASQVLADYERRTGHPAFDSTSGSYVRLKEVARELYQLSVVPDDELPENVSGHLYLDEGVIGYRPAEEPERQHFTVGHEIGHRALDHPPRKFEDSQEQIDDTPDVGALVVKDGVYRAYSEHDRWELEANVFAAELLMPVELVRQRVKDDAAWTVPSLARYFGVSKAAMLNQLAAAFLPGPGVPPSPIQGTPVTLDASQRKAVTVDGAALVLAGPGAGKTRVLVERFRFLVRERGVPVNRILALTFSNKAAEEMRERLAGLLPGEAHAVEVGTFHSLGLELLQAYGHHLGMKPNPLLLTEVDAFVLLRRRLGDVPLGSFEDLYRPVSNLRRLLQTVSRAKDELAGPEEFTQLAAAWAVELDARPEPADLESRKILRAERDRAAQCMDAAAVYATYQRWLREGGFLDYGDLIAETVRLCDLPEVGAEIRARWDHILVDELQDINFASGRLVHALDGGRRIVWAVGDPRQSIYRFRGASPVNMHAFTADYEGATVVPMEMNYRSVEDVVQAGRGVDIPMLPGPGGEPQEVPPLHAARGRSQGGPAVELVIAATGEGELGELVRRVKAEVALRPPGEIAVLCRTGAQAQEISEALEASGIENDWGGALAERTAFKDLVAVLLLAADEPQGLVRLARLPDHSLSGADLRVLVSAARQRGRSAQAALYAGAAGELEGLTDGGRAQAQRLKALVGKLGHAPTPWQALAAYLFEEASWFRDLAVNSSPVARRRLATLGQVATLARDFEGRSGIAGGKDIDAFLAFVQICLESGDLGVPDEALVTSDVVHVLTAHRSKGLEWPAVFVPNLAEGRFPLGEHDPLPIPPGIIRGATGADEALEERCLFYVAITRARDCLVLSRAEKYGRSALNAAPFLDPLATTLEAAGYLRIHSHRGADEVPEPSTKRSTGGAGERLEQAVPFNWLHAYEECGQRFKYEHVYGLRGEEQGSLVFHAMVDGVLVPMAAEAAAGAPPTLTEALARLAREWSASGLAAHWYGAVYQRRAEAVVAAFASRLSPGAHIEVRRRQVLRIDGLAVELIVDEHEDAGGLHIYRRYHYGQPAKTHRDDHRLALYAALHRQVQGAGVPYELRLHYPLSGLDEAIERSDTVIRNRTAKMAKLAAGIEGGEFEPRPSVHRCPACPFNCICPA